MTDVRIETNGDVRELVLCAPHRRNALNRPMLNELAAAIGTIAADAEARVLVVRGEGKSFCAGADLTSLFGDPNRRVSIIRQELSSVYAAFLSLRELTIPVISAVQGAAVGAGANIAFASDVVICGPKAKFGITFADIGLHPGGGASWFLTRALGAQRAKAVILGGEVIDADRAVSMGLALEVADDPVQRARELAELYATRDPDVAASMIKCVDVAVDHGLETVLQLEAWAQASSVTKPAFQEFLASFAPAPDRRGSAASAPGRPAYADTERSSTRPDGTDSATPASASEATGRSQR